MKAAARIRLDLLLVDRGFFDSREKAQRAILAGEVFAEGQRADKAGTRLAADAAIEITQKSRYVSRGGHKLEGALTAFAINPTGLTCIDIGASTGGFTDCLLQHGAAQVYAVDVGHAQLDWKIRSDPRVVVQEKVNMRYLPAEAYPAAISLAVIDVSFISLTMILPVACQIVGAGGAVIALIKPQFELGRGEVGAGGIVREPELHERAVEKIRRFVAETLPTWRWTDAIKSPILGGHGNKEFLACLRS